MSDCSNNTYLLLLNLVILIFLVSSVLLGLGGSIFGSFYVKKEYDSLKLKTIIPEIEVILTKINSISNISSLLKNNNKLNSLKDKATSLLKSV